MTARIAVRAYTRPFEPQLVVEPHSYLCDQDHNKKAIGAILSQPIDLKHPPKYEELITYFPKGSWIDDRPAASADVEPSENFVFGPIPIKPGAGFNVEPYGRRMVVLQVDVIYCGSIIYSKHLLVFDARRTRARSSSALASRMIVPGDCKKKVDWPFHVFVTQSTAALGESIKHDLVHGERSSAGIVSKNTPMSLHDSAKGGDIGRALAPDWSRVGVAISKFYYMFLLSQIQAALEKDAAPKTTGAS